MVERLIEIEEVARRWSLPIEAVQQLVMDGELVAYGIAGHLRIPEQQLATFCVKGKYLEQSRKILKAWRKICAI